MINQYGNFVMFLQQIGTFNMWWDNFHHQIQITKNNERWVYYWNKKARQMIGKVIPIDAEYSYEHAEIV